MWVIVINPDRDLRRAACYVIQEAYNEADALASLITKGEASDHILQLIMIHFCEKSRERKHHYVDEDDAIIIKELETLHDENTYDQEYEAKIKLAIQKHAYNLIPLLMRIGEQDLLVSPCEPL